ncbi:MAG: hypothetical protein QOK22_2910 [Gaiellaceae bacterium]|nr:hypothetical protein [Gaiellaceae bacterium]
MSDVEFLALHGLAVRKAGPASAVAEILGEDPERIASALGSAVEAGRAVEAKGTFMATPAGRDWLGDRYPEAFAAFRADPDATEGYERFERINRELLRLFTEWQMMPVGSESVPNDHSDPAYDDRIIDRLGALHERAERPLQQLSALEPRLAQYQRRLEDAYDKTLGGEHDFVSGAKVDSYHTVWFELHEDLLRMLGREREEQE